jgi:hypothetical protein
VVSEQEKLVSDKRQSLHSFLVQNFEADEDEFFDTFVSLRARLDNREPQNLERAINFHAGYILDGLLRFQSQNGQNVAGVNRDGHRQSIVNHFMAPGVLAEHMREPVTFNDNHVMRRLDLNDLSFTQTLSPPQRHEYERIRSEVLTNAMADPNFSQIMTEMQRDARQDQRSTLNLVQSALRGNSSPTPADTRPLSWQYFDCAAIRPGGGPAPAQPDPATANLQSSIRRQLADRLERAGIHQPPVIGADARTQDAEQRRNQESARIQADIAAGTDGAVTALFRNEIRHVIDQSRERYAISNGLRNNSSDINALLSDLGGIRINEQIDRQARQQRDLLTSDESTALRNAVSTAATELYREPGFAALSADDVARRITESALARAMADNNLRNAMPLVCQTLTEMQAALVRANGLVTSAMPARQQPAVTATNVLASQTHTTALTPNIPRNHTSLSY